MINENNARNAQQKPNGTRRHISEARKPDGTRKQTKKAYPMQRFKYEGAIGGGQLRLGVIWSAIWRMPLMVGWPCFLSMSFNWIHSTP